MITAEKRREQDYRKKKRTILKLYRQDIARINKDIRYGDGRCSFAMGDIHDNRYKSLFLMLKRYYEKLGYKVEKRMPYTASSTWYVLVTWED